MTARTLKNGWDGYPGAGYWVGDADDRWRVRMQYRWLRGLGLSRQVARVSVVGLVGVGCRPSTVYRLGADT